MPHPPFGDPEDRVRQRLLRWRAQLQAKIDFWAPHGGTAWDYNSGNINGMLEVLLSVVAELNAILDEELQANEYVE